MAEPKLNSKSVICILKVLLCLSLLYSVIADDKAYMLKLAKALKPTPAAWSASDFCEWNGVKCGTVNNLLRVVAIDLSSMSLTGTLPPDLNSLSQLKFLSLSNNFLSGALPSLANLSKLEKVFLNANNFTSIPDGCFQGLTSLQALNMNDNIYLSPWTIPTQLNQSPDLVTLDLRNANLVGTLPDAFDSFVSLQELRLSHNILTGGLPESFAGSEIRVLWLDNQNSTFGFSGTIQVLSSMPYLSQVWLQVNEFTGPIPDLSNCTSLFDLQLMSNFLNGVVPTSLMSLRSLKNVSLDLNYLQGPVPSFGKGVNFTLSDNYFCQKACDYRVTTLLLIAADFGYPYYWTGKDPCQDWNYIVCSEGKVITVNLVKRNLTGTISPAFANLTDLRNLYLNDNNLIGSIPVSLTNLSQLWVLDVSNNNLSGDVPKFSTKVKFTASGIFYLGVLEVATSAELMIQ